MSPFCYVFWSSQCCNHKYTHSSSGFKRCNVWSDGLSVCLPLCSHHDWQTGLRLSTGSGTAAAAVHQAMVSHSKDLQDVTVSFPDSKVKDLIVLLEAGYTLGHF